MMTKEATKDVQEMLRKYGKEYVSANVLIMDLERADANKKAAYVNLLNYIEKTQGEILIKLDTLRNLCVGADASKYSNVLSLIDSLVEYAVDLTDSLVCTKHIDEGNGSIRCCFDADIPKSTTQLIEIETVARCLESLNNGLDMDY